MVGYAVLIESDEQAAVEKRDRYVSALDRRHDAFGKTVVQRRRREREHVPELARRGAGRVPWTSQAGSPL